MIVEYLRLIDCAKRAFGPEAVFSQFIQPEACIGHARISQGEAAVLFDGLVVEIECGVGRFYVAPPTQQITRLEI